MSYYGPPPAYGQPPPPAKSKLPLIIGVVVSVIAVVIVLLILFLFVLKPTVALSIPQPNGSYQNIGSTSRIMVLSANNEQPLSEFRAVYSESVTIDGETVSYSDELFPLSQQSSSYLFFVDADFNWRLSGNDYFVVMNAHGSPLVGKWSIESIEYMGQVVQMDAGTFEFKPDGRLTFTVDIIGSTTTTTGHYEDLGGGEMNIKNGANEQTSYTISGNTLTLEMYGMEFTLTSDGEVSSAGSLILYYQGSVIARSTW